ncbi:MAG: tripartite tricarboxylate transporter substrate binding protein [Acetobacteraceae bacterium]|nr:tripartite tricarboxylate transporter substrate binding protein [Acetobacteraceae bacterium]
MLRRAALAALAVLGMAASAAAQEAAWPNRPITLMTGFPNGAGTDIYARRLAEPLSRALGQPVVVDHRTGAGGNIASDFVAKARPDGYLFLLGTAGTHAINATLYRNLPFDPLRDVTHIALLGDVPNVLLVNPEKHPDWRDCRAVIVAAKARPGILTYASTGNGASTHLAGVQFSVAAGIEMTHVPYRGQPGAIQALLGRDVDLFFNQVGPALGLIQAGTVRALGVTTPGRVQAIGSVPTIAEACGLPGFVSTTWYGMFAPPGLPAPIAARMSAEVARIITAPDFRQWLIENQGIAPPEDPAPASFRRVHQADVARWAEIVRRSGAQVD